MSSDIFSAVKGLFPSLYSEVDLPRAPTSVSERVRREAVIRTQQRGQNTQAALAFFEGKRLLGGNLLLGGGEPVDSKTTINFYAGLQQSEDDQYRLLIEQARERIRTGNYETSPTSRSSPQQAVNRLLEGRISLEEARSRYTNFDYEASVRASEERQARIDTLLEQTRERIANIFAHTALPSTSQRPAVTDIIPQHLINNPFDGEINLSLERRLATLRLDGGSDPRVIDIHSSLVRERANTFVGYETEQERKDRQIELGLTDEQAQQEILNDARGTPTHVQVSLVGRKSVLSQEFIERQRNIDPTFGIPKYNSAKGQLETTDANGITRTIDTNPLSNGAIRRETLTYQEYLNLRYIAPDAEANRNQIEYLSIVPFISQDGILDREDQRGALQTVSIVTPRNNAASFQETNAITLTPGGDTYTQLEFTINTERESLFQGVELTFEGTTFPSGTPYPSILQQLRAATGNILFDVEQLGINRNYIGNQDLLLDGENKDEGDSVRFRFFAREGASNGVKIVLLVKEDALNNPLIGLKNLQAKFF